MKDHLRVVALVFTLLATIAEREATASPWTSIGPYEANVNVLAADPGKIDVVYVGTDGGVFVTSDGGQHWAPAGAGTGGISVRALVVISTNPATLFAGTAGQGILVSTDGGTTWQERNTGLGSLDVRALAQDPSNPTLLYAGTNGTGVFRTTDAGAHWQVANDGIGAAYITAISVAVSHPLTIWAAAGTCPGNGGVFRSDDDGLHWSDVTSNLPVRGVSEIVVNPSNPQEAFVTLSATVCFGSGSSSEGFVFRTSNGGISWSGVQYLNKYTFDFGDKFLFSPLGLLAAGPWGVYESTDDGTDWNLLCVTTDSSGLPASSTALAFSGNLYVGTNQYGVAVVSGSSTTFCPTSNSGLAASDILTMAKGRSGALFAGGGPGLYELRSGPWALKGTSSKTGPVLIVRVSPQDPDTVYEVIYLQGPECSGAVIRLSKDGGYSWAQHHCLLDSTPTALVVDPTNQDVLYISFKYTFDASIFKSTDGGATMTPLAVSFGYGGVLSLALDSIHPSTLYAGTASNGVYKSFDSGQTWTATNSGLTDPKVDALEIDPQNSAKVYAGTPAGVFASQDAGAHWAAANTGIESEEVVALAILPTNSLVLFAGTSKGNVYESTDGAASWTLINPAQRFSPITELLIDSAQPPHLFAATNGTGVNESLITAPPPPCTANTNTLCLNGNRFTVTADWETSTGSGHGTAVSLSGDTGYFWFFSSSNVEAVVKVLNGCGVNGNFWVFAGGLTNVKVTLKVVDTLTGFVRTYVNPQGKAFQPIQDTSAFASCSADTVAALETEDLLSGPQPFPEITVDDPVPETTSSCTANATTLCLNGGRFRVTADWETARASGHGTAVALSGDTGYFWFFSSSNVEAIVKVLNGCGVNQHDWVFAGGLTNVKVTLTVTDTQTGEIRTYVNPQGTAFQPIQDTSAFADCT